MLGYMNEEAWEKTQADGKVTFFFPEAKTDCGQRGRRVGIF